ncbi:MAG: DUF3857 domain-containing protein, partial [Bacteroidota bacterium]
MKTTGFFVCISFFLLSISINAQNYAAGSIPAELKEDAHAVIRDARTEIEIIHAGKAIQREYELMTVLNAKGKKHNGLFMHYDQFHKVLKMEGNLYDRYGKKVRKLKKSDIADISGSGSSIATDDRFKTAKLSQESYPFTVEYTGEH